MTRGTESGGSDAGMPSGVPAAEATEAGKPLQLAIDGMSCAHCIRAVSDALRRLDGVSVLGVRIGGASVMYDPSVISVDRIVDAVNDEGYQASPA